MAAATHAFDLVDESATCALASRAARVMPAANAPLILYLEGELGVGKTSFARALLTALGETGPVRSPSYGLIAEYEPPSGRVVHLDLYRLQNPDELEQLGLRDYLDDSRLWLVEWPDRVERGLPAPDARLQLTVKDGGRQLNWHAVSGRGQEWLRSLTEEPGS